MDEKKYRLKFGENVRNFRLTQKLSQEKLAELACLHRTYIGGIERGERNVSLINIIRLAKALNIKTEDLFKDIHD